MKKIANFNNAPVAQDFADLITRFYGPNAEATVKTIQSPDNVTFDVCVADVTLLNVDMIRDAFMAGLKAAGK